MSKMDDLTGPLKEGDRIRITGIPGRADAEYTYEGYEPSDEGSIEFKIYLKPIEEG